MINTVHMDPGLSNTRRDLEYHATEQRKQRLDQEHITHAAAIFDAYGYDYYHLNENSFMSRAKDNCNIEALMNITNCYINNSSSACEIECDFFGYIVTIDLVKHVVHPGEMISIPIGSVVFVGTEKNRNVNSLKPTNVRCSVNKPNISSINITHSTVQHVHVSSPCENHSILS